jgi:hypothetical protein
MPRTCRAHADCELREVSSLLHGRPGEAKKRVKKVNLLNRQIPVLVKTPNLSPSLVIPTVV